MSTSSRPVKPPWMAESVFLNCQPRGLTKTIKCPGCQRDFGAKVDNAGHCRPEIDYHIHCIEECPKYAALGLKSECVDCGLKFLNRHGLRIHMGTGVHHWRQFQRDYIPTKSVAMDIKESAFQSTIDCPGCGQEFPAKSRSKATAVLPRIDYYVHCVEGCSKFKKLGRLRECEHCPKVFLDDSTHHGHMRAHVQHSPSSQSRKRKRSSNPTPSAKSSTKPSTKVNTRAAVAKSSSVFDKEDSDGDWLEDMKKKKNKTSKPVVKVKSSKVTLTKPKSNQIATESKSGSKDEDWKTTEYDEVDDWQDEMKADIERSFDASKFMIEYFEHDDNLPNVNYDLELPDDDDFGHFSYYEDDSEEALQLANATDYEDDD